MTYSPADVKVFGNPFVVPLADSGPVLDQSTIIAKGETVVIPGPRSLFSRSKFRFLLVAWCCIATGASILLISLPIPSANAQLNRLNMMGTFSGSFMGGSEFHLTQDGDRVVGKFTYGDGDGFARGTWQEGRLILILTPTAEQVGGSCDPRKIVVILAKGTIASIEPYVLDLANNASYTSKMARTSPSGGSPIEYPYEAELKNCGQLATYELAFETNSDQLKGSDWPILQTLADLMKKDTKLKIEVAGHTDSTGNAAANQTLSEKRANTVKKTLNDKYGVDASRLTAKGYGAEQPIADNGIEEGRAINRRVELVKQ